MATLTCPGCKATLSYQDATLKLKDEAGREFRQQAKLAQCQCGVAKFDDETFEVLLRLGYISEELVH